jgi:hypothetical protein
MPIDPTDSPEMGWVSDEMGWVSEDDAHRLLARAVELDARDTSDVSVAQLRDVAAEAGIAPQAFERALQEFRDSAFPHRRADSSRIGVQIARVRAIYEGLSSRDSRQLAKYRRHAMVACLAAAVVVTPGDLVVTSVVLAAPLYAFYETQILFGRWRERRDGRPASPTLVASDTAMESPARPRKTDGRGHTLRLGMAGGAPAV